MVVVAVVVDVVELEVAVEVTVDVEVEVSCWHSSGAAERRSIVAVPARAARNVAWAVPNESYPALTLGRIELSEDVGIGASSEPLTVQPGGGGGAGGTLALMTSPTTTCTGDAELLENERFTVAAAAVTAESHTPNSAIALAPAARHPPMRGSLFLTMRERREKPALLQAATP